jgi:hypothetical protein
MKSKLSMNESNLAHFILRLISGRQEDFFYYLDARGSNQLMQKIEKSGSLPCPLKGQCTEMFYGVEVLQCMTDSLQ